MELNNIELLLEKYENGMTSLPEERLLQEYFSSALVPDHLLHYKTIFSFTAKAKAASYPKEVKVVSTRRNLYFAGIAASIILAVGIFSTVFYDKQETITQHQLGTIEDPDEAYRKARETLKMVSLVLNTGKEELTYVAEFDRAKNKYLKQ